MFISIVELISAEIALSLSRGHPAVEARPAREADAGQRGPMSPQRNKKKLLRRRQDPRCVQKPHGEPVHRQLELQRNQN